MNWKSEGKIMKKILFASTALIATAGMAAADINWSGSGRFGLVYEEGATDETSIEHRFRLQATGIAETDGGVKLEGRIRFNSTSDQDGGYSSDPMSAAGFAVSTGGLRVDVGSVSDVFDSGDVMSWGGTGVGYRGFIDQASNANGFDKAGFGGADRDANTVKLRYTAGDFTGAASYTEDNATTGFADYVQVGVGYSFGNFNVGAMYGDGGAADSQWAVGAGGSFGDLSVSAIVGDNDNATTTDIFWGLSGSYAISAATSVQAAVSGGGTSADESYGIGLSHSLGGGVTLAGGVGSVKGATQADLGVTFSF
jgi:outer membrane protein OmpU